MINEKMINNIADSIFKLGDENVELFDDLIRCIILFNKINDFYNSNSNYSSANYKYDIFKITSSARNVFKEINKKYFPNINLLKNPTEGRFSNLSFDLNFRETPSMADIISIIYTINNIVIKKKIVIKKIDYNYFKRNKKFFNEIIMLEGISERTNKQLSPFEEVKYNMNLIDNDFIDELFKPVEIDAIFNNFLKNINEEE